MPPRSRRAGILFCTCWSVGPSVTFLFLINNSRTPSPTDLTWSTHTSWEVEEPYWFWGHWVKGQWSIMFYKHLLLLFVGLNFRNWFGGLNNGGNLTVFYPQQSCLGVHVYRNQPIGLPCQSVCQSVCLSSGSQSSVSTWYRSGKHCLCMLFLNNIIQ